MTTSVRCVNCDHYDHHPIDKMGHKTMPCFRKDETQPDGFCPCDSFKEATNAAELADAILGKVSTPREPMCKCLDPLGKHPDLGQCLNFADCRCEEFEWNGEGPRPLLLEETR